LSALTLQKMPPRLDGDTVHEAGASAVSAFQYDAV
jgi:hypothetical protein